MAKHMKENIKKRIKHNGKNKIKLKNKILYLVFIIVFIYSASRIVTWITSNINIRKQEELLRKEVVLEIEKDDGEKEQKIDFSKLKQINSDVIAWIEIPNTSINYPILQANDNEYYLKKDINKNYNSGRFNFYGL